METALCKNEVNNYSVIELNHIRESIENMNKFNQVEILRILNRYNKEVLNENKYGIHINLSEVSDDIIIEIKKYINYVNMQEINIKSIEQKKEDYKNTYFSKDIKDINKN